MLQAVAHEVKNLLAELALRVQAHDPYAAALAHSAANKLAQALLCANADQIAPQVDAAAPAELLADIAAEYGSLFPEKSLTIIADRAPVLWYYDTHLLRLALSNVVHNALKHCRQAVTLTAYDDDGGLSIEVRDDGPGFASHKLSHIGAVGRDTTSTGLGLRIARQIVEAHVLTKDGERRGSLCVQNDCGAVVKLRVP